MSSHVIVQVRQRIPPPAQIRAMTSRAVRDRSRIIRPPTEGVSAGQPETPTSNHVIPSVFAQLDPVDEAGSGASSAPTEGATWEPGDGTVYLLPLDDPANAPPPDERVPRASLWGPIGAAIGGIAVGLMISYYARW